MNATATVINPQPPPNLQVLISRAEVYMASRFGNFRTYDELFAMWSIALDRIEELSALDPGFDVENFVAATVPALLIKRWLQRYGDFVNALARTFLRRSGIPYNSEDVAEVTGNVWGILIPQWFRCGQARCLNRNMPIAALRDLRLTNVVECACPGVCKCPRTGPKSFQRCLYELTKHAAASWRSAHRMRTEPKSADCVWPVKRPKAMGTLDEHDRNQTHAVGENGIPKRRRADQKSHVVKVPKDTRYADACSTRKAYHFDATPEGQAALNAWKRWAVPVRVMTAAEEAEYCNPMACPFAPLGADC